MVNPLDDHMPLKPSDEHCAVLMRATSNQWSHPCDGLPVVEVRWRFEVPGVKVVRLCADHASVLTRRDRCLQVRPLDLAGRRWEANAEESDGAK